MTQQTNTFSKLKLVALQAGPKTMAMTRRERLTVKIDVQIAAAKALVEGSTFVLRKQKLMQDSESGERKLVEKIARFKQWWWTAANGKVALAVRYGQKQIELAKGKNCIELDSIDELVSTLELVKAAVLAGELDEQMAAAVAVQRAGFKKKAKVTV